MCHQPSRGVPFQPCACRMGARELPHCRALRSPIKPPSFTNPCNRRRRRRERSQRPTRVMPAASPTHLVQTGPRRVSSGATGHSLKGRCQMTRTAQAPTNGKSLEPLARLRGHGVCSHPLPHPGDQDGGGESKQRSSPGLRMACSLLAAPERQPARQGREDHQHHEDDREAVRRLVERDTAHVHAEQARADIDW